MSYDPNEFDGPPNPAAIDPAMERMKRMKQELSDTKALLRFQEMHKSAELIKDRERLDWLLKNSCIKVSGLYYTTRESLDEAIRAAESANDRTERRLPAQTVAIQQDQRKTNE